MLKSLLLRWAKAIVLREIKRTGKPLTGDYGGYQYELTAELTLMGQVAYAHDAVANKLRSQILDTADHLTTPTGGRVYEASTRDEGYQPDQHGNVVTTEPDWVQKYKAEAAKNGGDLEQ